MLKKIFLCSLLMIAGIIHLITPEVFTNAVPNFLIFKTEIILLTGVLEILLAIGIWIKKTQHLAALITTYYFIALVPVHMYVAFNGIEMFGVTSKLTLWLRTFFQYPLIFLAYSLTKEPWIIEQIWRHVVFIHYKIDPLLIEKIVPFKLDLYQGNAVISIVPFYMEGVRFPFLPPFPKLSSLWEINLRTYVEVDGVKGIYFFTLETDSLLGEFIAKTFFYLPYRYSKIKAQKKLHVYNFYHQREMFNFDLNADISEEIISPSEFDLWGSERYSLFTQHKKQIYRGIVQHAPWKLQQTKINILKNNFTKMILPGDFIPENITYSNYLKVRFIPFKKIGSI